MPTVNDMYDVSIKLKYPLGYQIEFTSWENDGDFYSKQVISGLTKPDVNFYIAVAMLFTSKHNRKNGGGMGNTENHPSHLLQLIQEKLEDHPEISETTKEIWSNAEEDDIHELLFEHILGNAGERDSYDYHFCRVFESFKVFEIREPVFDITDQFK